MSKSQDRTVYKTGNGKWANKKNSNMLPSSIHDTQSEAIDEAEKMLENDGGGEITINGEDGKFRRKKTVPDGNDPCPPRDKT